MGNLASFFRIPGNIKQQILPFVLNPDSSLNKIYTKSSDVQGPPQCFTFRNNVCNEVNNTSESGAGLLKILPNSFNDYINNDVSYKMLYAYMDKDSGNSMAMPGEMDKDSIIDINNIFSNFPAVQIREFLPDTQFDQFLNEFSNLMNEISLSSTMSNGIKQLESIYNNIESSYKQQGLKGSISELWQKIKVISQQFAATAYYVLRYMTNTADDGNGNSYGFVSDIGKNFDEIANFFNLNDDFKKNSNSPMTKVLSFPYVFYYKMQSTTTTNVYEIPYTYNNKTILESSGGMAGWIDGDPGGFKLNNLATSILGSLPIVGGIGKIIGGIIDPLLSNIGINYMPWWDANGAFKTKEPEIEITFDLFNDTYSSAMINFIFVNTLIPNNKWIQYGMFEHSQHIYDVKIEGVNRLFACAGAFNVEGKGVLRSPSKKWVDELVDKHGNPTCIDKDELKKNIFEQKLIKIPDIYHVTMKFQSLLPANFNNYIYNYIANNNLISKCSDMFEPFEEEQMSEAMDNAFSTAKNRILAAYDAAESIAKGGKDINSEDSKKQIDSAGYNAG